MLDAVTKGYLTLHTASAARTLARLDRRDAASLLNAIPGQLAGQLLERMAPTSAARCLAALPPAAASDIIMRTSMPAAVSVIRMLDEDQRQRLLTRLPRPKAARIRFRLRFSEWVIGAFADENVLTLSPDQRVGDALRLIRGTGQRTAQTTPVVDTDRRLVGIVDLCELLGNSDRRLVRHLMQPASHVLSARAAIQTVTNHPAWMTHDSLPVINRNGVFLGVLRRSRVVEKETHLVKEIVDRNELASTRIALADIFWLAVGSLFVGPGRDDDRGTGEA